MSDTYDFLPPGLVLERVERPTRWVQAGMQPDGVPPLEIEIEYFGAADVKEAAQASHASMVQRDFLRKCVRGWRNATLQNLCAIYKPAGKLALRLEPGADPGQAFPFNDRFFLEIYGGSYITGLYNPIFSELMTWSDDLELEAAGKGDSFAT